MPKFIRNALSLEQVGIRHSQDLKILAKLLNRNKEYYNTEYIKVDMLNRVQQAI